MMILRCKIVLLAAFCFLVFFKGIIRHDVSEKKYLKLALSKEFDCVGKITDEKDQIIGSCVLIENNKILSAAHVFIESFYKTDTLEINGHQIVLNRQINSTIRDVTKLYFVFNTIRYKAKKLKLHPNYTDSLLKGSCDLAIIELEKEVEMINPAVIDFSMTELKSDVTGVGFGASGVANKPESVAMHNKKIAGENVIDSLSGLEINGLPTLLLSDFDHLSDLSCNRMGSSQPRTLEYLPTGGDSGGGLFKESKSGWKLIGITSGSAVDVQQLLKTGYYGQIGRWTRIAAFSEWLKSQ